MESNTWATPDMISSDYTNINDTLTAEPILPDEAQFISNAMNGGETTLNEWKRKRLQSRMDLAKVEKAYQLFLSKQQ